MERTALTMLGSVVYSPYTDDFFVAQVTGDHVELRTPTEGDVFEELDFAEWEDESQELLLVDERAVEDPVGYYLDAIAAAMDGASQDVWDDVSFQFAQEHTEVVEATE